jgi:hypothetical protein
MVIQCWDGRGATIFSTFKSVTDRSEGRFLRERGACSSYGRMRGMSRRLARATSGSGTGRIYRTHRVPARVSRKVAVLPSVRNRCHCWGIRARAAKASSKTKWTTRATKRGGCWTVLVIIKVYSGLISSQTRRTDIDIHTWNCNLYPVRHFVVYLPRSDSNVNERDVQPKIKEQCLDTFPAVEDWLAPGFELRTRREVQLGDWLGHVLLWKFNLVSVYA